MRPRTNPSPDGVQGPLSESFCSDLRSGLTPVKVVGNRTRNGTHTPANDRVIAAAVLCAGILVAIASCAISAPSSLAPMSNLGSSVKNGTYSPREAADLACGFAATSCPEQLESNFGSKTFLADWGVNPEASSLTARKDESE